MTASPAKHNMINADAIFTLGPYASHTWLSLIQVTYTYGDRDVLGHQNIIYNELII